ncbi:hypothetical protein FAZ95_00930 [Trinickia violacea]|uniref:Uncharacterized protein n=1 Tax=Trinickia violacea TaxID=2571746 RepID=A0A4P8IGS7_9BURK|nr:hypothetical protein [Trinickia violacea]QCP47872.1 hypothetical protein FAZ95_00930 [Trinickia violacea]
MGGRVEAFWKAVQRRVRDVCESVPPEGQRTPGPEPGSLSNAPTIGRPEYYFYSSIRNRDDAGKWGIFILSGGCDVIADVFCARTDDPARANELANEFLRVCGDAHFRFDIYAMSCEGLLGRWRYEGFQHEKRQLGHVDFERVYVVHRAREWANANGLTDEVESILRSWTDDDRGWHWDIRRIGAYLSTALLDGYASVVHGLRFDQAEWANALPEDFAGGCPVHEIASHSRPVLNSILAVRKERDWFRRWGITKFFQTNAGRWTVDERVQVIGECFEGGRFPLDLEEVKGDFECVDTNVTSFWRTVPCVVRGDVNLSSEMAIGTFSIDERKLRYSDDKLLPGTLVAGTLKVSVLPAGNGDVAQPGVTAGCALGLLKVRGLTAVVATAHGEGHHAVEERWVNILNAELSRNPRDIVLCQTSFINEECVTVACLK